MPKNILIFSDGTGQAGGLMPDETRSNVYKLFRATRCGPDSAIDPAQQLAFYDPGLGSRSDGGGFKVARWRWIYNVLSQATGLGVTQNIIDCYAAIIRLYEPGDRICLFGFSRGAYTARCVGGVLKYCGVPSHMPDGSPIKRDPASSQALATYAVRSVYQFGSSKKGDPYKEDRYELARRFRREHRSGDDQRSNAAPYFIGVWDTVAALGASWTRLSLFAIGLIGVIALLAFGIAYLLSHTILGSLLSVELFWRSFWWLIAGLAIIGAVAYLYTHVKFATGLSRPWYRTLHITGWRMRFYDTELDPAVGFARHALSIDENRRDFARVSWTHRGAERSAVEGDDQIEWFKQAWFAGVHSDVGGSYAENASRLSDIALQWMVEEAQGMPHPILVDPSLLRLWPSSAGPQHDERKSTLAQMPQWLVSLLSRFLPPNKIGWTEGLRSVPEDAPLHPSVLERFEHPGVLAYDVTAPYRPQALRRHQQVAHFYR
jgi:uncharacterized protein (DUF2235 family)